MSLTGVSEAHDRLTAASLSRSGNGGEMFVLSIRYSQSTLCCITYCIITSHHRGFLGGGGELRVILAYLDLGMCLKVLVGY